MGKNIKAQMFFEKTLMNIQKNILFQQMFFRAFSTKKHKNIANATTTTQTIRHKEDTANQIPLWSGNIRAYPVVVICRLPHRDKEAHHIGDLT